MSSTERYRLVRTVASGGMAQVVEAVARGIDGFERRVAIKRLLPQHVRDGERRRMFLEEARIGSRLHHGSIVPIFDYGLIDGSEFLAMEFVDGLDALRAVSRTTEVVAMPEGIALHIAVEIAHALAYIHDLGDENGESPGIVHRDVSPPNILLSWDGDVKLSDFGIALSGQRNERTIGGVVKGKLHYMAPEQAMGERATTAADVYALGATLDALLGGQAMTPSMSDEETARRMQQARDRGVSPAVCALVGACLARNPLDRPRAGDVAARAGALASQRLGRDGRGALRAWLQPLRSRVLRQSKLDDLMGLCLVPVGVEGARTFTVSQVWQPPPTERTEPARPRPAAPRPNRLIWASLAAATVGGALLGWHGMRARMPATHPRPDVTVVPVPPSPVVMSTNRAPTPEQIPLDESPPDESPRGDTTRPHRPSAPHPRVAESAPLIAPTANEAAPRGWLRIGGPTFAGARVSVDGIGSGFAPVELALAAGPHTISITAPASGHVLLHKTVRLGEHHTRVAPLRILR